MEAILSFATVLGPIVLLAVIVYAWARNRKTRNSVDRKAERGARELREEVAERPQKDIDL